MNTVAQSGMRWIVGIFFGITFGGVLAFAMGMAAVGIIPLLVVMGPPLFVLARVQKREQGVEDRAMRAADADRIAHNPPPPVAT